MDGNVTDLDMKRARDFAEGYGYEWNGVLIDRLVVCEKTVLAFLKKKREAPEVPEQEKVEADEEGWFYWPSNVPLPKGVRVN